MMKVIKEETIQFSNQKEYLSAKTKLGHDQVYATINWTSDDNKHEITYETEEITPTIADDKRIKVFLLFKNPHPDSVASGLFFSERYSKSFWNRFFEVECNKRMLPLLENSTWIDDVAEKLLSGKYDSPFLYYFRCLYPFPTKQFSDLTCLFCSAPLTYRNEFIDNSLEELLIYIEKHDIRHIIVFFKNGMELLTGKPFPSSRNVVSAAKKGIDQALRDGDESLFWQVNSDFRRTIDRVITVYLNMNTRDKNHGTHLPKRYFTYNLEFILKDILKNSPDQNHQ